MKALHYILVFTIVLGNNLNGQSFSIFSVYQYGDELNDAQYKKVMTSEWHKQEANKALQKIHKLDRKIKIELAKRNSDQTLKTVNAIRVKRNKLKIIQLQHLTSSHQFMYEVYQEKIDVLWQKYENNADELMVVRAMESNGKKLLNQAEKEHQQLEKYVRMTDQIEVYEKSIELAKKGLDMVSSALEGYYNYDLAFKKSLEDADKNLQAQNKAAETGHAGGEIVYINQNEIDYSSLDETQFQQETLQPEYDLDDKNNIVISADALLIYSENEEILNLIMNNYNVDKLQEVVVISVDELKQKDVERMGGTVVASEQPFNESTGTTAITASNAGAESTRGDQQRELLLANRTSQLTFQSADKAKDLPGNNSTRGNMAIPDPSVSNQPAEDVQKTYSAGNELSKVGENTMVNQPENKAINLPLGPPKNNGISPQTKLISQHEKKTAPNNASPEKNASVSVDNIDRNTQIIDGSNDVLTSDNQYEINVKKQSVTHVENGVVNAKDKQENTAFKLVEMNVNDLEVSKSANDVTSENYGLIVFRVQIAAHRQPIPEYQLRQKYRGNLTITTFVEGDWHKYIIGEYVSFEEAKNVRQHCGVKDAFIAAYLFGEKITLKDALGEDSQHKN